LAEAGIRFQDLDLVAACTGPGSFTSVRTGLAAARGIAVAAGKSLVGATSLEVIAAELVAQGLIDDRFAVALDARKDEIYLEMFSADGCPTAAPTLVGATATPPGLTIAAGPGGHILAGWIGGIGRAARIVGPDIVPTAGRLARMAPTLPRHGRASPVYLRAADAKPPAPSTLLGRAP
jgi:tRNA threonylcarbamoyl adenosine modification protein YeaZ